MKKLNHSAAILLIYGLIYLFSNSAFAQISPVDIPFLLNANTHPYFLQPYTDKEQQTLKQLYYLNQNQLLWFSAQHPVNTIDQLLDLLADATEQGLNNSDYASDLLRTKWQKLQQSNPGYHEFAIFDTALSLIFFRYLHDLHYGRIVPDQLGFSLAEKKRLNFASRIYGAIQINAIKRLVDDMQPKLIPYQQLKQALAHYRRIHQHFGQSLYFNFSRTLYPGDWSTDIPKLDYYLTALDTPVDQPITEDIKTTHIYTPEIAKKVRKLQTQHNLPSDGVIGKQTVEVLNTPLSKYITQIELAMERLRWLPERPKEPFILVNIPAFQLWAYGSDQNHTEALNMRVVVGKARNNVQNQKLENALQTPVFSARLSYLVFNPYWNIPTSILKEEILPLIEKKPGYLQRQRMEIVANFSHDALPLPVNQENISRLYTGNLYLRQRPGPGNALGHIKFIFPNKYNIYLHDTPAQSLFNRSQRDFSHGCIRVENPLNLAQFALQNQPEWDDVKIWEMLNSKEPNIVDIKQTIPVLIFYSTAFADNTGVVFYADIYEHDHSLKTALNERSELSTITRLATSF